MGPAELAKIFQAQSERKVAARNTSCSYRLQKLKAFKRLMLKRKRRLALALEEDFGKPQVETDLTEILPTLSMLNLLERKLAKWMRPEKIPSSLIYLGTSSYVKREGKGVCLVISPWNYPFQLAVYPALTAFAAGNTCVLKPSEFAPATNREVKSLFSTVFDPAEIAVVEGDAETSQALLELPFDHIFFTGSERVGQMAAQAAIKNFASFSLELGGKSPCVVDGTGDWKKAARKIAWGKMVNAGQTCVAPDYVLVPKELQEDFAKEVASNIASFYPSEGVGRKDFASIINERHGRRLESMVKEAVERGATLVCGGGYRPESGVMEPTVLTNVPAACRLMEEEIFGPALPIIGTSGEEDILREINSRPNPLALYIFSERETFHQKILHSVPSGSATINDVLIATGHPQLPFGGIGRSGMGRYHGKYGFDEFSHLRPVMKRKGERGASLLYPPYGERKVRILDWLLRKLPGLF